MEPVLVYLDWNIIVGFKKNRFQELRAALIEFKKKGTHFIPYTEIHVDEIRNIKRLGDGTARAKIISEYVDLLDDLSDTLRITVAGGQIFTHYVSAEETLKQRDEEAFPGEHELFSSLVNIVDYDTLNLARKMLNLDPQSLNNYSPEEIIDVLDKIVTSDEIREKYYPNYQGDLSFRGVVRYIEDALKPAMRQMYTSFGLAPPLEVPFEAKVPMIYQYLDSLGFWANNRKDFNKPGRSCDGGHCVYGLIMQYFISDDRDLRQKAKVLSHLYGSKSKILSSKEALLDFELATSSHR